MANDLQFSVAQLFEIRRQAKLELARRYAKQKKILEWGKLLFPDTFNLPFCRELHQYFADIRGAQFTSTEAPRNHAKTTIKCFLIPIFQALEEPDSFQHYLNVQATQSKALSINRAIRSELESNEILHELYGDQRGNRWTDEQFVTSKGVIFSALGASQSIKGIQARNKRPDYIIVDDLYDEDDLENPESTAKKTDWFWSSLFPARAKSRKHSVHVQGTAVNPSDLLEQLKTKSRWVSKTFKAIKDEDRKDVLWVELNSFDSLLADREDMGSVIFDREMQNQRRDSKTTIIKRAWIKEYDPDELIFNDNFVLVSVMLGVDPSIGEKLINDSTGIVKILKARYRDSKRYVYYIDKIWNEQLSLNGRIDLLNKIEEDSQDDHPITLAIIEGIAGFKDFVSETKRRTKLSVREIVSVKDKITNLVNKSHNFESGNVFVNKNIDRKLKQLFIDQMTMNHPKHDDVRDAALLCLEPRRSTAKFWFIDS